MAAAAARDFERQRNESGDLQLVKRLAWELLHASQSGQAFAVWAVGVMYSAAGERQVVAVSHLGAGYVPAGVTVPGFVRMLWSDPLIDDSFRQRWVGWLDPAATLVAYAKLKAAEPAAWRLAAAATTWTEVEALMAAAQHMGTEWATCSALTMPTTIEKEAAAARAEYVHRLVREFPELDERVAELTARRAATNGPPKLITDALVDEARLVVVDPNRTPGDSRLPANIEAIWPAAAEGTVAPAERAKFAEAVQQQWLSIGLVQPGWTTERSASDEVEYRARWLIARALEAVLGWIIAGRQRREGRAAGGDIVYAAAHAHLDDRGTGWISRASRRGREEASVMDTASDGVDGAAWRAELERRHALLANVVDQAGAWAREFHVPVGDGPWGNGSSLRSYPLTAYADTLQRIGVALKMVCANASLHPPSPDWDRTTLSAAMHQDATPDWRNATYYGRRPVSVMAATNQP